MSHTIQHFLLVYDHRAGRLIDERSFGRDRKAAMDAYAAKEREHLGKSDGIEVVLIGSDSIETVRLTHANYFSGNLDPTEPVSRFLAGI